MTDNSIILQDQDLGLVMVTTRHNVHGRMGSDSARKS